MSRKVSSDDYPEIIEKYNSEGSAAASEFVRGKYGIEYPSCLISRLRRITSLGYDKAKDRFEVSSKKEDEIFLNLEELCGNNKTSGIEQNEAYRLKAARTEAMESMVHSLISDRLLELSRYVLLDPIGKKILINKSSMQAEGYCVMIS